MVVKISFNNLMKLAPQVYGDLLQEDIAIKEMSTLTKDLVELRELERFNDIPPKEAETRREGIAKDIADVFVMLNQLCNIYNCHERTNNYIHQKCRRLAEDISNETKDDYVYKGK